MKKFGLLVVICLSLVGCFQPPTTPKPVSSATEIIEKNEFIKLKVQELDQLVKAKKISSDEAQTKLQTFIKDLQKLNDGSVRSILTKISLESPQLAKTLEQKIRENHPEIFEQEEKNS